MADVGEAVADAGEAVAVAGEAVDVGHDGEALGVSTAGRVYAVGKVSL